jgi:hypothetical protein
MEIKKNTHFSDEYKILIINFKFLNNLLEFPSSNPQLTLILSH